MQYYRHTTACQFWYYRFSEIGFRIGVWAMKMLGIYFLEGPETQPGCPDRGSLSQCCVFAMPS